MIPKAFDQIGIDDLQQLVALGVSESRQLDFKRQLPGPTDKDAREFVADVVSFANSAGGDVVYGVDEEEGRAVAVPGLMGDLDQALLRLGALIRTNVEPRLTVAMEVFPGPNGPCVVIRIPSSFAAPHRSTHSQVNRFYGRDSREKFEMDVTQLREAFEASSSRPRRLKAIHEATIASLNGDTLPLFVGPDPFAVLTVAPLRPPSSPVAIDMHNGQGLLHPPGRLNGRMHLLTLEGGLSYSPKYDATGVRTDLLDGFGLLNRAGHAEFGWIVGRLMESGDARLWIADLEKELDQSLNDAVGRLEALGVTGPWSAQMTILNTSNSRMALPWDGGVYTRPIRRKHISLPDVIFDRVFDETKLDLLKLVWATYGEERPGSPIGLGRK